MEEFEFRRHVGEIRIEYRIAFCFPPKPFLNDSVQWYAVFAIAMRDSKNFILREVAVLGLKESIRPQREHGRMPRKVAVLMDDLVHFRTKNEVVIDGVSGQRTQVQFEREAIVDIG